MALAFQGGARAQDATPVCISNGISYQAGEVACIPGCHGAQRLARCDVVANYASWTTIANQCPSALLTPIPKGSAFRPVQLSCNLMPNAPFAQFQGDRGLIR
jgi:hypothetical protein